MSIYLWSDIHIDFGENLDAIESLDAHRYQQDAVIIAGDVTHDVKLLKRCFISLTRTFKHIFFTPGNHDLWLYKKDFPCSVTKLNHLLHMCHEIGVHTSPKLLTDEAEPVWIVPLHSWYCKPEWGTESLYVPKQDEDPELKMWADNIRVNWDTLTDGVTPDKYMLGLNQQHVVREYQQKVISFSHFLPNRDIIFPDNRAKNYIPRYVQDPFPQFNFTRVAGSSELQTQISIIKSVVHAYGHQHRNKSVTLNGIQYVSHCMGYPTEEPFGPTGDKRVPLRIWPLSPSP